MVPVTITPRIRPTGRRSGDSGTRDALIQSAARLFAEHGYDGASLRLIAADAGVDPALIRHFFGAKEGLFMAALTTNTSLHEPIAAALAGDPAGVGRRAASAYLALWEDEPTASTMRALFRSAVASRDSVAAFVDTIAPRVLATLSAAPPDPQTLRHLALASSQLLGVAVARYVLEIKPLVAMTRPEVVDAVAPSIQLHLEPVVAAHAATPVNGPELARRAKH